MAGKPVRVGFIIDELRPGAGTENQLILLLKSLDRNYVEPYLCVLRGDVGSYVMGPEYGCSLSVRKLLSPSGVGSVSKIKKWLKWNSIEVLVTFFRDANILGTLGGRMAGVPVVSSRRNLGTGYWHDSRQLVLLRILNHMTAAFVANSMAVRDYTIRLERVDGKPVEVIPNAIDTDRFQPPHGSQANLRRRNKLPDGILIACVANLRPIKAHGFLLDCFAGSQVLRDECHLLLIGEGPEEATLRSLVQGYRLEDRVIFMGTRADVSEILQAADIGVLTSRAESSPNSIVEYMAAGLPTVATRVGGVAELLDEGRAGIAVPSASQELFVDALEKLVRCPEDRKRMGTFARRRAVERHAVSSVMARWTAFFQRFSRGHDDY